MKISPRPNNESNSDDELGDFHGFDGNNESSSRQALASHAASNDDSGAAAGDDAASDHVLTKATAESERSLSPSIGDLADNNRSPSPEFVDAGTRAGTANLILESSWLQSDRYLYVFIDLQVLSLTYKNTLTSQTVLLSFFPHVIIFFDE